MISRISNTQIAGLERGGKKLQQEFMKTLKIKTAKTNGNK
jgi:hypothetical protein